VTVFISYARSDDEAFVRRLRADLTARGIAVWFDRENMPSRSLTFMDEIRRAIDAADRLLVVIGPGSVASEYVRSEWQYALARGKAVTPVLRAGAYGSVPAELSGVHCPDVRVDRPERESFAEIARVLTEPVPPLGRLHGPPSLPPHFRPRPDDATALAAHLLAEHASTALVDNWRRVTLVTGMGGVGKSVLVAASARSTSVRRVFTDGIYWIDARDHPDSAGLADTLARRLDGRGALAGTPVDERLREALRDRRCLVVLDNVSDVRQLAMVARCLDLPGRLLVTTRDAGLVDEARHVAITGLSAQAGRQLLADWIGAEPVGAAADFLLRRCEGLPFALALCGAMAAHGTPLESIADRVAAADLGFLERRFPEYPYPSLLPMLDASLDALRERDAAAVGSFVSLAVFRDGARIPTSTVERFWRRRGTPTDAAVAKQLSIMHDLSVIRIEGSAGDRAVLVHPLVHDYVAALAGDPAPLHRDLVAAYRLTGGGDPADGPDDGYYHANLTHHLLRAGLPEIAVSVLTDTPSWLRAKQRDPARRGSFTADVDLVLRSPPAGAGADGPALDALVRLRAARHVAQAGPSYWGGSVLRAMVAVGDEASALASIRATVDPTVRVRQLVEIHRELDRAGRAQPELLMEARAAGAAEPDPARRRRIREILAEYTFQAGDLAEALGAWAEYRRDERPSSYLQRLLLQRLLTSGRADDARRVAAGDMAAEHLVELVVAVRESRFDDVDRLVTADSGEPDSDETDSDETDSDETDPDKTKAGLLNKHAVLAALVAAGQFERARRLARSLPGVQRVLALTSILDRAAVLEALELARELPDPWERSIALASCAEGLERVVNVAPAPSVSRWSRWRRPSRRPAPSLPDPAAILLESRSHIAAAPVGQRASLLAFHAQRAVARGDPAADDLVRAWRAAIDADSDASGRAAKLGELARTLADTHRLDAARKAVADAVAAAESAEGVRNAEVALAAALPVLAHAGRFSVALERALAITDEDRRSRALAALAVVCGNDGLVAEIDELTRRSPKPSDRPEFGIARARAMARRGREAEAIRIAEALPGSYGPRALAELVSILARDGRSATAGEVANLLLTTEPNSYETVVACCAMARVSATGSAGESRRWLALAEGNLPASRFLDSSLARTAFASAVGVLDPDRRAGVFTGAIEAARTVEEPALSSAPLLGPSDRWRALESVGRALVDTGLVDQALAEARSLDDDGGHWEALKATLIAYAAVHIRRDSGDGANAADAADAADAGDAGEEAGEEAGEAAALIAEARRHVDATENGLIGTNWNLVASSAVARQIGEAGDWRQGLEVADRAHPSLDAYLAILAHCCATGPGQEGALTADHLAATMEIVGWVRPDWARTVAELTA
jgi:hypothetical protein